MKKIYKFILWSITGIITLPVILIIVIFIWFVFTYPSYHQKELEQHAEWVKNTPQEVKNSLLSKEEVEKATGIRFPPFKVIDMCLPSALVQDPCVYWELELLEEFETEYFNELVQSGRFIYDDSYGTYSFMSPVKEGKQFSDLELILDGMTIKIFDTFELKETY